jgi:hypothetical protein
VIAAALCLIGLFIAVVAWQFLFTPSNRFPSEALEALEKDPHAVIYLIDPESGENTEGFHGYAVMGHTVVSEPAARSRLASDIASATRGAWDAAACFEPRHAFRATGPAGTYDFLLCFSCGRALVFHPDGSKQEIRIQGKADALNQYLVSHGIRLAK